MMRRECSSNPRKSRTSSTKHIDYMPSHRHERRKQIYDPKKQLYSDVRHSPFITPYISTSVKEKFNIVTNETGARSPSRLYMSPRASTSNYFYSSESPRLRPPSPGPSEVVHPVIPSPHSPLPPSSPPSLSPSAPPTGLTPTISIEDDRFAYRCVQALKIAVAAEAAIEIEETHIWARIREEELVLGMLHDDAEDTGSRRKAAMYQVKSIYDGARLFGVELPDVGKLKHEAHLSLGPRSPSPSPTTPPGQLFDALIADVMTRPIGNTPDSESLKLSPLQSLASLPPAHDSPQISQHSPSVQVWSSSQTSPSLESHPTTSPPFNSITSASGAANRS